MSDHDPFDGIYEDAPVQASKPASAPVPQPAPAPEPAPAEPREPAVEVSVYTHGQLDDMRKAELQVLARERGLDDGGTRDDLIERIETAQGASV